MSPLRMMSNKGDSVQIHAVREFLDNPMRILVCIRDRDYFQSDKSQHQNNDEEQDILDDYE